MAVRPADDRFPTKVKAKVLRIADGKPAAGLSKCIDLRCGPDGGRLGARQGGPLWLWRDAKGSGRRSFGVNTIHSDGIREGGSLDLGDRHLSRQHESDHYGDTGRGAPCA